MYGAADAGQSEPMPECLVTVDKCLSGIASKFNLCACVSRYLAKTLELWNSQVEKIKELAALEPSKERGFKRSISLNGRRTWKRSSPMQLGAGCEPKKLKKGEQISFRKGIPVSFLEIQGLQPAAKWQGTPIGSCEVPYG